MNTHVHNAYSPDLKFKICPKKKRSAATTEEYRIQHYSSKTFNYFVSISFIFTADTIESVFTKSNAYFRIV